MSSRIGHGVLISITVIALLFASVMTSYAETTTYTYDELNRLIQVIYEDGKGVIYTYDASGNRITLTQSVDTEPPTGTIIINSGAACTNNQVVTLTLTCSDNAGCS
jgi:YD repeat-containing protein